jgi:hypothetical protein
MELQLTMLGDCRSRLRRGIRLITENRFTSRRMRLIEEDDVQTCGCRTAARSSPGGAALGAAICADASCCDNVRDKYECLIGFCSKRCANMRMQRKQWCPSLRVRDAGDRGLGVFATEALPARAFLLEYVGEVIDEEEKVRRMEAYARGARHFYVMALMAGNYLDAAVYRNVAAYINHSCTPNCAAEFWSVGRETRVGLFASRALGAGEELTLDYGWKGALRLTVCVCGAKLCRALMNVGEEKAFTPDAMPLGAWKAPPAGAALDGAGLVGAWVRVWWDGDKGMPPEAVAAGMDSEAGVEVRVAAAVGAGAGAPGGALSPAAAPAALSEVPAGRAREAVAAAARALRGRRLAHTDAGGRGTWYTGRVSGWVAATGKHRVTYAGDGEVEEEDLMGWARLAASAPSEAAAAFSTLGETASGAPNPWMVLEPVHTRAALQALVARLASDTAAAGGRPPIVRALGAGAAGARGGGLVGALATPGMPLCDHTPEELAAVPYIFPDDAQLDSLADAGGGAGSPEAGDGGGEAFGEGVGGDEVSALVIPRREGGASEGAAALPSPAVVPVARAEEALPAVLIERVVVSADAAAGLSEEAVAAASRAREAAAGAAAAAAAEAARAATDAARGAAANAYAAALARAFAEGAETRRREAAARRAAALAAKEAADAAKEEEARRSRAAKRGGGGGGGGGRSAEAAMARAAERAAARAARHAAKVERAAAKAARAAEKERARDQKRRAARGAAGGAARGAKRARAAPHASGRPAFSPPPQVVEESKLCLSRVAAPGVVGAAAACYPFIGSDFGGPWSGGGGGGGGGAAAVFAELALAVPPLPPPLLAESALLSLALLQGGVGGSAAPTPEDVAVAVREAVCALSLWPPLRGAGARAPAALPPHPAPPSPALCAAFEAATAARARGGEGALGAASRAVAVSGDAGLVACVFDAVRVVVGGPWGGVEGVCAAPPPGAAAALAGAVDAAAGGGGALAGALTAAAEAEFGGRENPHADLATAALALAALGAGGPCALRAGGCGAGFGARAAAAAAAYAATALLLPAPPTPAPPPYAALLEKVKTTAARCPLSHEFVVKGRWVCELRAAGLLPAHAGEAGAAVAALAGALLLPGGGGDAIVAAGGAGAAGRLAGAAGALLGAAPTTRTAPPLHQLQRPALARLSQLLAPRQRGEPSPLLRLSVGGSIPPPGAGENGAPFLLLRARGARPRGGGGGGGGARAGAPPAQQLLLLRRCEPGEVAAALRLHAARWGDVEGFLHAAKKGAKGGDPGGGVGAPRAVPLPLAQLAAGTWFGAAAAARAMVPTAPPPPAGPPPPPPPRYPHFLLPLHLLADEAPHGGPGALVACYEAAAHSGGTLARAGALRAMPAALRQRAAYELARALARAGDRDASLPGLCPDAVLFDGDGHVKVDAGRAGVVIVGARAAAKLGAALGEGAPCAPGAPPAPERPLEKRRAEVAKALAPLLVATPPLPALTRGLAAGAHPLLDAPCGGLPEGLPAAPPEALLGLPPSAALPASDAWALGACTWHFLAGGSPPPWAPVGAVADACTPPPPPGGGGVHRESRARRALAALAGVEAFFGPLDTVWPLGGAFPLAGWAAGELARLRASGAAPHAAPADAPPLSARLRDALAAAHAPAPDAAAALLERLLAVDPARRAKPRDVLAAPFFSAPVEEAPAQRDAEVALRAAGALADAEAGHFFERLQPTLFDPELVEEEEEEGDEESESESEEEEEEEEESDESETGGVAEGGGDEGMEAGGGEGGQ